MTKKFSDTTALLYLSSVEQRRAAARALLCFEDGPLVLAAVYKEEDHVDSFLESVSEWMLFEVKEPLDLSEQIDPSDLIELMVGEVNSCFEE